MTDTLFTNKELSEFLRDYLKSEKARHEAAIREIANFLSTHNEQVPSTSTSQKPQPPNVAGPVSSNQKITLDIFEREGKINSRGSPWIFADRAPELAKKVEAAGYSLDVDGVHLSLSRDGKFLTAWGKKTK